MLHAYGLLQNEGPMKQALLVQSVALAAAVWSPLAWSQGNSAAMDAPNFSVQDPCRSAVSKFEQAISFVRQSQGTKAAAELKEKLLPAKTENEILFKDGYCGIAKYLKEKKLNR